MTATELAALPEVPDSMRALWREADDPVYIWDESGAAWTVARIDGKRVRIRQPREDRI